MNTFFKSGRFLCINEQWYVSMRKSDAGISSKWLTQSIEIKEHLEETLAGPFKFAGSAKQWLNAFISSDGAIRGLESRFIPDTAARRLH